MMTDNTGNVVAKVTLAVGREVILPISGYDKPEISSIVMKKWQDTMNLAAKIMGVPTGLITHIKPEQLEIFVSSQYEGNPFKAKENLDLGLGMYCETTTGTCNLLHVPDARDDEAWKDNPGVGWGLVSYLGMPLKWPDGEVFGTICFLDTKGHKHSEECIKLVGFFRESIETDLEMALERHYLSQMNLEKEISLREAHHRIKNHLNMLVAIMQINSSQVVSLESFNEFVENLSRRIFSISELHSQMATAKDSEVKLDEFLETILSNIVNSVSDRKVTLHFKAEPIEVSRDYFFHTGLLVSELATNSIKHAFTGIENPEIELTLEDKDEDSYILRFRDNGIGLPENMCSERNESIGISLICELPEQMGGSCSISTGSGAAFEIILKKRPVR